MAENVVHSTGRILFDPVNISKKHDKHASWKRVALLMFDCDISGYYAWFIRKRFNLILQPPIRGAHISFINDSARDMNGQWENVRNRWNGREIDVALSTDVRTDGEFWWLNTVSNEEFMAIRSELGLGDPFFRYHMTIGSAVNFRSESASENNAIKAMGMHEEHSRYIHGLIRSGFLA